jgi:hypothetical protein
MKKPLGNLGSTARRVLFCGLALALGSFAHAADRTVVGLITHLSFGDSGNPSAPTIAIAIKPALPECFYGFMSVPATGQSYGKMVTSAAIAAQAGNNAVSITYDNANGCTIKQFAVITP